MNAAEETCQYCQRGIHREEQAYVLNGKIACQQCDEKSRTEAHPVSDKTESGECHAGAHDSHQSTKNRASTPEVIRGIIEYVIFISAGLAVMWGIAVVWLYLQEHPRVSELRRLAQPFDGQFEMYAGLSHFGKEFWEELRVPRALSIAMAQEYVKKPIRENARIVAVDMDTKFLHDLHRLYKAEPFWAQSPAQVDGVVLIRDITVRDSRLESKTAWMCAMEIVQLPEMRTIDVKVVSGRWVRELSRSGRRNYPVPPYPEVVELLREWTGPSASKTEDGANQ
jgi:hypothetical protein